MPNRPRRSRHAPSTLHLARSRPVSFSRRRGRHLGRREDKPIHKVYRQLYPQVYDWENLLLAWRKARKGKRGQPPLKHTWPTTCWITVPKAQLEWVVLHMEASSNFANQ